MRTEITLNSQSAIGEYLQAPVRSAYTAGTPTGDQWTFSADTGARICSSAGNGTGVSILPLGTLYAGDRITLDFELRINSGGPFMVNVQSFDGSAWNNVAGDTNITDSTRFSPHRFVYAPLGTLSGRAFRLLYGAVTATVIDYNIRNFHLTLDSATAEEQIIVDEVREYVLTMTGGAWAIDAATSSDLGSISIVGSDLVVTYGTPFAATAGSTALKPVASLAMAYAGGGRLSSVRLGAVTATICAIRFYTTANMSSATDTAIAPSVVANGTTVHVVLRNRYKTTRHLLGPS